MTEVDMVIGNYFFDTLKQDVFKFQSGKVYEGSVSLSYNDETDENKWIKSLKKNLPT